ncbi:MAG: glycosyltransferase [Microscillaceae bacterium]|nr:glycosyltransferase [Microscillaceae bacterium]
MNFLWVIDNTEGELHPEILEFFQSDARIHYHKNPENLGVAAALNLAAYEALAKKCTWLLTMDQDSHFLEGDLARLIQQLANLDHSKIGIFSPKHVHSKAKRSSSALASFEEVNLTMTSGNLLNLEIFKEVGGFCEKLFIDHVDHEYCLRLRSTGYRVIQSNQVELRHELGKLKTVRIAGKIIFKFISHNPLRGYYMFRNGLYVAAKYRKKQPFFYSKNIKLLVKEVLKILIFENKKGKRLNFVFKGIKDYQKNRFGKLLLKSN